MARICKNYKIDKSTLGFDLDYVKRWENEKNQKMVIVSQEDSGAYMLLHKTDYDPLKIASYRYVIDFIFVPDESRRQSIAFNMLTSHLAYNIDLAAFPDSEASQALFFKVGFRKDGELVIPLLSRDAVERNVGKNMKIVGLKMRPDLNGTIVTPSGFHVSKPRYVCTINDEKCCIKPTNLLCISHNFKKDF